MFLNDLKPAVGERKNNKRVGRGIGSGCGKTGGKGHKGQKARAGGFHKVGFEGGQMPLQRRLPKIGFKSRKRKFTIEVRLHELSEFSGQTIDFSFLKKNGWIPTTAKKVRIIDSGELKSPVNIIGLCLSDGVRAKIEAAGGRIEG